jgi:hypothetical protein
MDPQKRLDEMGIMAGIAAATVSIMGRNRRIVALIIAFHADCPV